VYVRCTPEQKYRCTRVSVFLKQLRERPRRSTSAVPDFGVTTGKPAGQLRSYERRFFPKASRLVPHSQFRSCIVGGIQSALMYPDDSLKPVAFEYECTKRRRSIFVACHYRSTCGPAIRPSSAVSMHLPLSSVALAEVRATWHELSFINSSIRMRAAMAYQDIYRMLVGWRWASWRAPSF
jgi:hypothetical protein